MPMILYLGFNELVQFRANVKMISPMTAHMPGKMDVLLGWLHSAALAMGMNS